MCLYLQPRAYSQHHCTTTQNMKTSKVFLVITITWIVCLAIIVPRNKRVSGTKWYQQAPWQHTSHTYIPQRPSITSISHYPPLILPYKGTSCNLAYRPHILSTVHMPPSCSSSPIRFISNACLTSSTNPTSICLFIFKKVVHDIIGLME